MKKKIIKVILGGFVVAIVATGIVRSVLKPSTTGEMVEAYNHGHVIDDMWVRFEVTEIVEHDMVGQSFWADDMRVAFINEDYNYDVEVGDTLDVVVIEVYTMFDSYIAEFDSSDVRVKRQNGGWETYD